MKRTKTVFIVFVAYAILVSFVAFADHSVSNENSGDDDLACANFLQTCSQTCESNGGMNEEKSLCKTWENGMYKSCVCSSSEFMEEERKEQKEIQTMSEQDEEEKEVLVEQEEENEEEEGKQASNERGEETIIECDGTGAGTENMMMMDQPSSYSSTSFLPDMMMRTFFGDDMMFPSNSIFGDNTDSARQSYLNRVFRTPFSLDISFNANDDSLTTNDKNDGVVNNQPFVFFSSSSSSNDNKNAKTIEDEINADVALINDFQTAMNGFFNNNDDDTFFSTAELGEKRTKAPMTYLEYRRKNEHMMRYERMLTCIMSISLISLLLYSIFVLVVRVFAGNDDDDNDDEQRYYEFSDDTKTEPLLDLELNNNNSDNENDETATVEHYKVSSSWKSARV